MPANLPPDYYAAERRYREAKTVEEKILILQEMMAIMPKHKGTEHLRGDLKRKIAKLNSQKNVKSVKSRSRDLYHIPHEGAGQVVLVGLPNSGKSSIAYALTEAHVHVADFPFSTFKPIPGMIQYEDIQIQLIDLPPVIRDHIEPWLLNCIRIADVVALVVDGSTESPFENLDETLKILCDHHIHLENKGDKRPQGTEANKTGILVWTKMDLVEGDERRHSFLSNIQVSIPQIFISSENSTNMNVLTKKIYKGLNVIRIYTKVPGKKIDRSKPYILSAGTTVYDAAKAIHKDLSETMTYARIWGSEKYEGQRVEKGHILMDRDVLEIHNK